METKLATNLIFGFLLILIFACGSEDADPPILSTAKAITDFSVSDVDGTIDEPAKTITAILPNGTDLTALSPVVAVSPKATVNPASGASQDFSNSVMYKVTAEDGSSVDYAATVTVEPCASSDNIYGFTYNGTNYEVVRENKTWEDAAACAAERGGFLAEINDADENAALFNELTNNASITNSNTTAADGGGASYVWIGGNDIATESAWIWDGNNDGATARFWQGAADGNPVDGLYNNWGNEPDDFGEGQDALGLALTEWPLGSGALGSAAQWNDVSHTNELYYIIEYK